MNILKINHIEFVPCELIKEEYKNLNYIFVLSHRRNKRMYKEKHWLVGFIHFHKKAQEWCFTGEETCAIGVDTLVLISLTLRNLNDGKIIYDKKEGIINAVLHKSK